MEKIAAKPLGNFAPDETGNRAVKWAVILSAKLPDYAVNDQARFQLYKEAAALFAKAVERARFSGEISSVCNNWAGALVHAAHVTPDRELEQSLLREALEKFDRAARAQPGAATTYAMWGNALIDLGARSVVSGAISATPSRSSIPVWLCGPMTPPRSTASPAFTRSWTIPSWPCRI